MKSINRRDFLRWNGKAALVLLGLYLGVPGCRVEDIGGDYEGGGPRTVVKLGYLPITDHLVLIAHGKSTFKHVDLRPVKFAGWPELAEGLRAGAIDAGFALTPIGLQLRQEGVPVKAVLLGHRNGSVITVGKESGIRSLEDLPGKTVAVPSRFSTHNILIHKVLSDRGIDPARVRLLDMAPPEMVQALAGKQIDAFIVAEPFGGQAELQGVGRVLMLSKDIWPNHICCVLNIREEVIQKNPDAVQELVAALVEAGRYIEGNPGEAALLSTAYMGQDPAVIEHVLTTPADRVTYDDLLPVAEDFAAAQRYMRDFQIADNNVDLAAYLEDGFARRVYGR